MGMIHQIWTRFLFSDMTRFILSKQQSVYKAKTFFDFLVALILSHITIEFAIVQAASQP